MANVLARIGIFGDSHLCCKHYGAHRDYAAESIEYFKKISDIAEEKGCTHLIGTGDLTYGKFDKLEYRRIIECELERQNKITNNNRYELCGNHDKATNGMTEYEYYVSRGLLKGSTNFSIGNLNITMLDYKANSKFKKEDMNIHIEESKYNIVIAHQYFKFKDTQMANFGDAILLDNYEPLFGTDFLILGHIHHRYGFDGNIVSNGQSHKCVVQYMGCMMRPAYREGLMDNVGNMTILTYYDDNKLEYDVVEIPLWPLEKSFNIEEKILEKEKKEEKEARVDISDIVKQLDAHDRSVGNPEDIIKGMTGIDEKYKNKAVELLMKAIS